MCFESLFILLCKFCFYLYSTLLTVLWTFIQFRRRSLQELNLNVFANSLHQFKRVHVHATLIQSRLIIESSFKLTFWTQIKIKSNCSHFQFDSSWIAHIFNLMQLDSTENWVNSTWFIKNLSLMSRKLNIEIFPTFALSFCIIFLIESHEEKTWRSFDKESWWET